LDGTVPLELSSSPLSLLTLPLQYFEETLMLEVNTEFYIWIKDLVLIPRSGGEMMKRIGSGEAW
jgi:hypothetical protein